MGQKVISIIIIIADKTFAWLAWKMPKRFVYWCTIRAGSHATTGKYGDGDVGKIGYLEVIERYNKDFKLNQ
jgi:hypothetical protein